MIFVATARWCEEHWVIAAGHDRYAVVREAEIRVKIGREIEIPWEEFQAEQRRELAGLGFTDTSRRFWEADHIVPVAEGGGGCGPDGYRTLCLPCHRRETAKLAARLAERRRTARQPELVL